MQRTLLKFAPEPPYINVKAGLVHMLCELDAVQNAFNSHVCEPSLKWKAKYQIVNGNMKK